uniref:C3H1-type domain-containing protein n=1 Tax=Anopheles culicifacies TaxID=139723 RepID=A0A182MPX8_9DIPT
MYAVTSCHAFVVARGVLLVIDPRLNQTNTSRGNTQIVGGGGVGGANVHSITPVGGASSNSNAFVFSPTLCNVTAALAATSNIGNGQQTLNNNHHMEQQQQQSQQSPHFHRKVPLSRLLLDLDDASSQHKQQQGGTNGGGATHHHPLFRTASQPATHQMMGNLLEMFAINGLKLSQDVSFCSSSTTGNNTAANSISSNNGNNQHATTSNTTSSSSGHRKLERTQSEPLPQQVNTSRYKTELCRPYEEAGECKYGDKCQFAHGMQELRNLQRHPKYKTELCRTFHSVGFCPYGPRCHFVHNAEEARNHNRNVAAYHARLAAAAAAAAGTNSSQSSQGAARTGNNNGPSMLNSNNQQHHHGHAISPTLQQGGAIPQPFLFPTSPPASPIEGLSPMATPPPSSPSLVAMKLGGAGGSMGGHANSMAGIGQEERLPVFNMLSSVVEPYAQLSL